jgi:molybdopterin-containing oxidoreductase family iron-sulfur binding subunit
MSAADATPTLHRRAFLERMGAALAAAGLPACPGQDPPERIVPYARQPELLVPGTPLYFASSVALGAHAYGVLVETHEGRPTKIEGNPGHPASLGATDALGQALVRDLYDPERSTGVLHRARASTWPAFLRDAGAWLGRDARVALLTGATTSRTLTDAIARFQAAHPRSRWHVWEPVSRASAQAGLQQLLGASHAFHLRLDRARVALSLDDDLLTTCPGRLRHARHLAQRRRPGLGLDALRLYTIESFPTLTGAMADHRRSARVTDIPRLAHGLVRALLGDDPGDPWLTAAAADLRAAGRAGLVTAGLNQPPLVHALAHAANHALAASGETIVYTPRLERGPDDPLASLRALVGAIDRNEVDALLILDVNPVLDAPADLDLAAAIARVPICVYLGPRRDETGEHCEWQLPLAHPLEAWADARADDGTLGLSQPTIRPMYGGLTPAELLTTLLGDPTAGRDLLERAWRGVIDPDRWPAAIHDGYLPPDAAPVATTLAPGVLAALLATPPPEAPPEDSLVLAFRPDPVAWDGRFAHNPWLQELPRPITRLVWGNAAFLAPATATALGLAHEDRVRLTLGERSVEAPLFVLEGHPPGQVTVHLGNGRRTPGAGAGVGFDAYPLRTSDALWSAPGARLQGLGGRVPLIHHHHLALERGDEYARMATRQAHAERGALAFAGEGPPDPPGQHPPSLHPTRPLGAHAWAMTIDLNACIGCGACVIACQAENNIPTVGPAQAAADRVLHWIRIDTYRSGAGPHARWRFQPVPCMQCEHAPCEVVCPTGATQHSDDGLNDMVYNRCIGTRYCANNCPYKVRRFNFFKYADAEPVTLRLQRNPDVTVRTRGVMEKCTYCVQRIRGAEIAAIREARDLRPGEVVTACQAACPAAAIRLGDLAQPGDPILAERREPRAYALLSELGTRPRTTYLGRLDHPNPALVDPHDDPHDDEGEG